MKQALVSKVMDVLTKIHSMEKASKGSTGDSIKDVLELLNLSNQLLIDQEHVQQVDLICDKYNKIHEELLKDKYEEYKDLLEYVSVLQTKLYDRSKRQQLSLDNEYLRGMYVSKYLSYAHMLAEGVCMDIGMDEVCLKIYSLQEMKRALRMMLVSL